MVDATNGHGGKPLGVLLESKGFTNWTATTTDELVLLTSRIDNINLLRAERGLAPIRELNIPADIPADFPEYTNTTVTELLAGGARVWVIDLDSLEAFQTAYGQLPGIFTFTTDEAPEPRYGVAPIVDFSAAIAAGQFWPRPTPDGDAVRSAVGSKLTEARDLLIARVPADNANRSFLAGADMLTMLSPQFTDALTGLSEDPTVMLAASALHTAVGMARAGNLPGCLTWCENVAQSLADVPAVADVNPEIADSIPLAWVSEDEIHTGNVTQLGEHLAQVSLGAPDVSAVYAVAKGALVPVAYTVNGTPYDENDWATATLTVTLPDGSRLEESWRVDGRA